MKSVKLLGVNVDCVDFDGTLNHIQRWIETRLWDDRHIVRATHQICTVNPEFIVDARRDPAFSQVLAEASLCVPDGIGVLWAAKRAGVKLRERVTGSDGIYHISERAAERGWRIFLLGAAPGVANEAAQVLCSRYPTLIVAGTYSGNPDDREWPTIRAQLEKTAPDLLFVAFGHPQQDMWIAKHKHELGVQVAIGVGGAFDFVAGVLPRAPKWMQVWGLEWLYRLLLQPTRIRRMIKLPIFVVLVLWEGR